MENRPLEISGPNHWPPKGDEAPTARRVFCAEAAPLRLADGTPLHLEWVIEAEDGELYRVPSTPGGWFRRTPYRGGLDGMLLVSPQKASTILWITYADTENNERVETEGHSLEQWAY